MPLVIDGHNLIGTGVFPDIRLSDVDDEAKLIARLRVWKSRYRGEILVVFDRGIPGGKSRELSGGGIKVSFAATPNEADDLILRRIRTQKPGLIVVTDDEKLRREATQYHVRTWRSSEFVQRMKIPTANGDDPGAAADVQLSAAEVEEWLKIFGRRKKKGRP